MQTIHTDAQYSFSGLQMVPVAIYTRVSTINQVGGRFDSCESQAAICRSFVGKHAAAGWFEVAYFSDPAYSGGSMSRPGLHALMRLIEANGVKVVVIYKLERILRCTGEWATLRTFLKKHGCGLASPSEDLSGDTPSGRLRANLLMSVAEYERLNTSDKVRAKMLEQAKRGFWNTGQVPYGYNYDLRAQMLLPNATEASVVRRIFEMAAQLLPLTEVAAVLNAENLKTRTRVFRRRDDSLETIGGKKFRTDSMLKLITIPFTSDAFDFVEKNSSAGIMRLSHRNCGSRQRLPWP